jgi:tetratricopeptide (TPR) repeat protein
MTSQAARAARLAGIFNRALPLHQSGRLQEAAALYGQVLSLEPANFDALHLLGVIHIDTGRPDHGAALISRAIAGDPNVAAAYSNLGKALNDLGRHGEALANCDVAIRLEPNFADAHNNRGLALYGLARAADAAVAFGKAIALAPGFAQAHRNRGMALQAMGRPKDALASYDRAIALGEDLVALHLNRGLALRDLDRQEEALESFDLAIGRQPDVTEAHHHRGLALADLGHPEGALASFDAAIALNPSAAVTHYSRAEVLDELMRPEESMASYDRAIALKPDFASALWNRSLKLLQAGRFEAGWRDYEWRKAKWDPRTRDFAPERLWSGQADVNGKTIFVYSEQGFGDTLQFCRYVKLLEEKGASPVLAVQAPLSSLLQQLTPATPMLDEGAMAPRFDLHISMLSLPLAFGTTLQTIPAPPWYLRADPDRRARMESRLGPKVRPRVGLAWSGNPTHRRTYDRSIPLAHLRPLLAGDIDWICLQKELRAADAETLKDVGRIGFQGDALADFGETAALVDAMDLVITIDTSIAHLAGAMGRPVWILLPLNADWRWFLDRSDSPWYPSARLFRQRTLGDWRPVIEAVAAELQDYPFAP